MLGLGLVVVVIAVGGIVADSGGSSYTYTGPGCVANAAGCAFTSNGYWIPLWYYHSLQTAQFPADSSDEAPAPSTQGVQPTAEEDEADGASPAAASSAEDAAESDDSGDDGGDDSGDDGGDDSGGDDSGDDDGGDDDSGDDDGGGDDDSGDDDDGGDDD